MNTAEDFMDASNKILSMNLKGQQRQDVLFVMLEIVQRQKQFNQYYVFLLGMGYFDMPLRDQSLNSLLFASSTPIE